MNKEVDLITTNNLNNETSQSSFTLDQVLCNTGSRDITVPIVPVAQFIEQTFTVTESCSDGTNSANVENILVVAGQDDQLLGNVYTDANGEAKFNVLETGITNFAIHTALHTTRWTGVSLYAFSTSLSNQPASINFTLANEFCTPITGAN